MKQQGSFIFPVILVISLLLSIYNQGAFTVTGEKEKEKKKKEQTQTTETEESKSESKSKTKLEHKATSEPGTRLKKKVIIAGEPKKYTGKPGTFIFNEADLKNVLLFFAKTYKLNIVIDPGVSGKVTVRLINVPWDQALELILRQHGLAMSTKGNLITAEKLKIR